MPNGVDPTMDWVQVTHSRLVAHLELVEPNGPKLLHRNDAVLSTGEFGDK
jgi:hypothetical protein